MNKFPTYKQTEAKDCGPTCIKMIAKYYGKTINTQQLRTLSETTREGSSLLGLSEAAESIGLRSLGSKLSLKELIQAPLPCILHWNKSHFVVLYKIKKGIYYISDPAHGLISYSKEELLKNWIGNNANEETQEGIILILDPTPKFYQEEFEQYEPFGFSFFI